MLLKDAIISNGRIIRDENDQVISAPSGSSALITNAKPTGKDLSIPGIQNKPDQKAVLEEEERKKEEAKLFGAVVGIENEDEEDLDEGEQVHSFEIAAEQVEVIKKRCNDIDYPMLEEYDFRNDTVNANLEIDLRPTTVIRPYQEKSLSKMFGNG